jgi:conjugative relaxase-like TrwC/TraI family protein
MVTAASIGAARGGGYARYLEGKTIPRGRGDYYLSRDGEPVQAPGRWLASTATLEGLGIEGRSVRGGHFVALMEGRHPESGRWLRRAGADGERGGGIDLTFSAPKSVSVVWAFGDGDQRATIEAAHARAVQRAVEHLRESVPVIRRRQSGVVVEDRAADLVAAEYRHTTSRGVAEGELPDPQLHSHVVVTSAVRDDGQVVAVASRPVFRAAREIGAFYRSALASELQQQGFAIETGTGKDGRYFEIAGVPEGLREAFSKRSREVARAAERFRARYGRAPERGELRSLAIRTRASKVPVTRGDLERAWRETAEPFGFDPGRLVTRDRQSLDRGDHARELEDRVAGRLTERAATFTLCELRAVVLEQSAGQLTPEEALESAHRMIAERRVLPLEGGQLTTLEIRAAEQAIERRLTSLASPAGRQVDPVIRECAAESVGRRIGGELSDEQNRALAAITGPERAAVLIGPAGTEKGVVIDAAAFAEQVEGRITLGIAVAGSTAQRLAQDSPSLQGQTLTADALLARVDRGRLRLDHRTTVYLDEAGMIDTRRLDRLTDTIERSGAKLVLIGDAAQLPSIGAGGMFDQLTRRLPTVELEDVRRTLDPGEQRAWADLRAGRADRALAHYKAQGRLHISEDRDQAIERASRDWARLTDTTPVEQVVLISDASNLEINRLNARAQHHRLQRGELGDVEIEIPGVHYGLRAGDHVALIDQHHSPDQPRVENGARGRVQDVSESGRAIIAFQDGQQRILAGQDLGKVRLAYAQHVHRAQGATVDHALVITGGWQTAKEPAYVQASRARQGAHFYVNRHDLGTDGNDLDRVSRLAERMRDSRTQTPTISYHRAELPDPAWGPGFTRAVEHFGPRLPALVRSHHDRSRPQRDRSREHAFER